ncbi:MAG TPA: hypothetical protein P5267_01410 [Patescibacteria group bacterium]|nr:hypothetical protein [Patescibacteria group bacterium]
MLKIRYPKFTILILSYFVVIALFGGWLAQGINSFIVGLGYWGAFLAGVFYAYSFTAGAAVAILVILGGDLNIIMAGLLAGVGSLISDLLIFKFIRHSFEEEITKISASHFWDKWRNNYHLNLIFKKYILPILGSIIIASPLPDELGVAMLASDKLISSRVFAIMSYALNTAGIFIILLIGK